MLMIMALVSSCASRPPSLRFLDSAWENYRTIYIQPEGFVLDPSRDGGRVTSEGQAYALLTAVWQRDHATFSRVLSWTDAHLRRADGLYSWLWSPEGSGGLVDTNTAADADQEIAFALILAADAFGREAYRIRALDILEAIREVESLTLPGGWFPAAGNWATEERIINLSYFIPYAYPFFAHVHPDGDWMSVIDVGYDLLGRTLAPIDSKLIPDFMAVNQTGGVQPLPRGSKLSRDFSFDAVRIFWRVAADCRLHHRRRACEDPLQTSRLDGVLVRDGVIFTRYSTQGEPLTSDQSLSFYGSVLPALRLHVPELADVIIRTTLTDEALASLRAETDRYYDRNWVWFGIALDSGLLEARIPSP
jgi:endo-1,4-beta-D-glucanase Y